MGKDPDVRLDEVMVVGETMSKRKAMTQKKSIIFNLPYNLQDKYFFFSK